MSFGFTVSDGSQYDVNTRTRTITKIDKVLEFSVVNYPAYAEASVEARQQIQEAELKYQARQQALIGLNKLQSKEIK
ncbi:HK97 family phage prohead protease, partial [Staphylococcus pseudintermedius]|nr:HK97 family phage prohead protease [Staphylococcus pseudintermedius]